MKDYHPPQVWDSLQPQDGVVYQEGPKQKKGPSYLGSTFTVSTDKSPLRMTRQEYNLKMTRIITTQTYRPESTSKTQTFFDDTNSTLKLDDPKPFVLSSFTQLRSVTNPNERPGIKIHSSKFLEALNAKVEEPASAMKINLTNTVKLAHNRAKSDTSRLLRQEPNVSLPTENDQFNMKILTNSDWGKTTMVGASQTPVQFPKSNQRQMRASVGRFIKLPRDRDMHHTFYSTKGINLSSRSMHKTEI